MFRRLFGHPVPSSLLLVLVVFSVDLCLPLGVASAVPYTFAVLRALAGRPGWFGPAVAGLCGFLTVLKLGIVPDHGTTEYWKVLANRALAVFAISMTAFLGVRRRAAEEELRQHQTDLAHLARLSMAGQLAAGLAHELNQPLAAVCLQADLAARMAAADARPELRTALAEVAEQSARAAEVLKAVRRMVRRTDPGRDPVDLNAAAQTVARLLDGLARKAGVDVRLELADRLPAVAGDRAQLEQVLANLVQNGIEAAAGASGPRTVRVGTEAVGREVVARVRDTGPGLADPTVVFERFRSTKPDGLGLGLAISRAIAEAHGGRLLAGSEPGGGAEFLFVLPAADGT